MKEDINKIVQEEIKKIQNKRGNEVLKIFGLLLFAISTFTTIIFGVYLLPQVIASSDSMKQNAWILTIGVLGYGVLPLIYIFDKLKLFEEKQ